jgi:hypothetical protein
MKRSAEKHNEHINYVKKLNQEKYIDKFFDDKFKKVIKTERPFEEMDIEIKKANIFMKPLSSARSPNIPGSKFRSRDNSKGSEENGIIHEIMKSNQISPLRRQLSPFEQTIETFGRNTRKSFFNDEQHHKLHELPAIESYIYKRKESSP